MWSKGLPNHLQIYDTGQQQAWLHWLLLGEYGYHPMGHMFLIHALDITGRMQKKKEWFRWLLMREFGHHMIYLISLYLLLCGICLMSLHIFLFGTYLMFMYVLGFERKHNSHMVWHKGACLYYFDETDHMSITILLLHDLPHDNARRQQESFFLWLLLGEYGMNYSHTLHDIVGGWKEEALQHWLLLKDYGHCTWYSDDVMGQQGSLLRWLLLREYGHYIWYNNDGVW